MTETAFTKLMGVSKPIQLAGMPGITTPELIAAIASAGGLGMLGAAGGHVRGTISLQPLLSEVLEVVKMLVLADDRTDKRISRVGQWRHPL